MSDVQGGGGWERTYVQCRVLLGGGEGGGRQYLL